MNLAAETATTYRLADLSDLISSMMKDLGVNYSCTMQIQEMNIHAEQDRCSGLRRLLMKSTDVFKIRY